MIDPRQPAYDAVFAHIGTLAAVLPADTAHRNAMIWKGVQAALDAADNARTAPDNPVASTDAADNLPQVGWYCWRCEAINTEPCKSDSVPVHVPADWAVLMTEEIAKRDEEGDDEPAAVVINPATGFGLSTGATGASPSMDVQGRCPACRLASLFLGSGGYVTCRSLDCPQPDAASTLLDRDVRERDVIAADLETANRLRAEVQRDRDQHAAVLREVLGRFRAGDGGAPEAWATREDLERWRSVVAPTVEQPWWEQVREWEQAAVDATHHVLELKAALARVRAVVDRITVGAPWAANQADIAARLRAALDGDPS